MNYLDGGVWWPVDTTLVDPDVLDQPWGVAYLRPLSSTSAAGPPAGSSGWRSWSDRTEVPPPARPGFTRTVDPHRVRAQDYRHDRDRGLDPDCHLLLHRAYEVSPPAGTPARLPRYCEQRLAGPHIRAQRPTSLRRGRHP